MNAKLLAFSGFVIVCALVISGATYFDFSAQKANSELEPPKKALIADALNEDYPNRTLIKSLAAILEKAGYSVTIVEGKKVDLSLYASLNRYSLIILRTHGGINTVHHYGSTSKANALFTGVPWNPEFETLELMGLIAKARPYASDKEYVAVRGRFFLMKMHKRFSPGTIMIVASCYSLYSEEIVNALFSKGLDIFIGWKGGVSPDYMDKVIEKLVRIKIEENISWYEAVSIVNEELGPDPYTGEKLLIVTKKE